MSGNSTPAPVERSFWRTSADHDHAARPSTPTAPLAGRRDRRPSTSTLNISGDTFDGDTAGTAPGGAIYTSDTDLTVGSSTFSDDVAGQGGAMAIDGSNPGANESITSSSFTGNHTSGGPGGAVMIQEGGLSIKQSTFSGNAASQDGGGLFETSGDAMTLVNDTFDGNQCEQRRWDRPVNDSVVVGLDRVAQRHDRPEHRIPGRRDRVPEQMTTHDREHDRGPEQPARPDSPAVGGDCFEPAKYESETRTRDTTWTTTAVCFGGATPFADGRQVRCHARARHARPTTVVQSETDALLAGSPAVGARKRSRLPDHRCARRRALGEHVRHGRIPD